MEELTLSLGAGYLDTEFRRFSTIDDTRRELGVLDLSGNRLSYSPRWTASSTIRYDVDLPSGKLSPYVDANWTGKVYFSPFNVDRMAQEGYFLLGAGVTYTTDSGWRFQVNGRNLTDKTYITGATISGEIVGFPILGQYSAPRTVEFTVGRSF